MMGDFNMNDGFLDLSASNYETACYIKYFANQIYDQVHSGDGVDPAVVALALSTLQDLQSRLTDGK